MQMFNGTLGLYSLKCHLYSMKALELQLLLSMFLFVLLFLGLCKLCLSILFFCIAIILVVDYDIKIDRQFADRLHFLLGCLFHLFQESCYECHCDFLFLWVF